MRLVYGLCTVSLLLVTVSVSAQTSDHPYRRTLELSSSFQKPDLSELSDALRADIDAGHNLGLGILISNKQRRYGLLLSASRYWRDFHSSRGVNNLVAYFLAPGLYVDGGYLANRLPVSLVVKVGYLRVIHNSSSGGQLAGEIAVRVGRYNPTDRFEGFIEIAYMISTIGDLHYADILGTSVKYDFTGPRLGIVLGIG